MSYKGDSANIECRWSQGMTDAATEIFSDWK